MLILLASYSFNHIEIMKTYTSSGIYSSFGSGCPQNFKKVHGENIARTFRYAFAHSWKYRNTQKLRVLKYRPPGPICNSYVPGPIEAIKEGVTRAEQAKCTAVRPRIVKSVSVQLEVHCLYLGNYTNVTVFQFSLSSSIL